MEHAETGLGRRRRLRPRRTVVDEIWGSLRQRILHGEVAPGTRLVELELAEEGGVSQASVREALHRLERDGLVVRRGRGGTFVTGVYPEEIQEIARIRSVVEGFAAARTARTIRPEQLAELEGYVDRMREAGRAGDAVALVEADMAFHQRICAWAGNPVLLRVWAPLHTQFERFLALHEPRHFDDLTRIADRHCPILEALRAHDPEAASRRIREHVESVLEEL